MSLDASGTPSWTAPMSDPQTPAVDTAPTRVPLRAFFDLLARERVFLIALAIGLFLSGVSAPYAPFAMWVGFAFAGYSAVANDSIQTIGTFIASNRHRPWWVLWLFMGGIFLATTAWSYLNYGGDVSFGRLGAKGFETAPTSFSFLQVASPLVLLVLTRMRMPVSTTLLLLSGFTTQAEGITSVITKSLSGYAVALTCAMGVWLAAGPLMQRRFVGKAHPAWRVVQWCTSGALWSVWLQQDAANIAVYLPRSLGLIEVAAYSLTIFGGLGLLFWQGGERIQRVVDEKSNVVDVRAAAIIDLVYAVILYVFKEVNNVPMSTTWVFIGLLGGRELAMSLRGAAEGDRTVKHAMKLMGRDLLYATIGFIVALLLAAAVNPVVREGLFSR
jgi:hypothetical protein